MFIMINIKGSVSHYSKKLYKNLAWCIIYKVYTLNHLFILYGFYYHIVYVYKFLLVNKWQLFMQNAHLKVYMFQRTSTDISE